MQNRKKNNLQRLNVLTDQKNLPSAITVQFTPAIESGYDVLKVNDLSMRYDQIVFEHCNLDIKKENALRLLVKTGLVKPLYLKALVGQLPIEHGKIRFW